MRDRGFTLAELVIVLAIIAFIAAMVVPSLVASKIRSNEATAVACLRTYVGAQNVYRITDYDGDLIPEYAHPYPKLNTDTSPKKKGKIRLIDGAFAKASRNGPPGGKTFPRAGYVFIDLTGDEGGESYDDGKGNFIFGHGLCAVPHAYGKGGRNTFVVNALGTVYQKGLGSNAGVTKYPDMARETWVRVGD